MKHKIKPKQSFRGQRGVSALEFTILAPLVFVLLFGMIEFGILFYDKAMITNASREGARAGIGNGDDPEVCESVITSQTGPAVTAAKTYLYKETSFTNLRLIYFGSPGTLTITPTIDTDITGGSNYKLKVQVSWPYNSLLLTKVQEWFGLDPITLNAVTVMMMESNPTC